jgi:hypothetical protein
VWKLCKLKGPPRLENFAHNGGRPGAARQQTR